MTLSDTDPHILSCKYADNPERDTLFSGPVRWFGDMQELRYLKVQLRGTDRISQALLAVYKNGRTSQLSLDAFEMICGNATWDWVYPTLFTHQTRLSALVIGPESIAIRPEPSLVDAKYGRVIMNVAFGLKFILARVLGKDPTELHYTAPHSVGYGLVTARKEGLRLVATHGSCALSIPHPMAD